MTTCKNYTVVEVVGGTRKMKETKLLRVSWIGFIVLGVTPRD